MSSISFFLVSCVVYDYGEEWGCVCGGWSVTSKTSCFLGKKEREGSQDSWESGIHLNIVSSYGYWVIVVFPFLPDPAYNGIIFTLFFTFFFYKPFRSCARYGVVCTRTHFYLCLHNLESDRSSGRRTHRQCQSPAMQPGIRLKRHKSSENAD